MVKMILFLLGLTIINTVNAQTDSIGGAISIIVIDQPPYFRLYENGQKNTIYSENKLKEFISDNLNYSCINKLDSIKGKVYISFWIDTTGITYDHIVIRGVREDLDKEALRVTKLLKFEKPAMQRGKPIKVQFTVPIEFRLYEWKKKQ